MYVRKCGFTSRGKKKKSFKYCQMAADVLKLVLKVWQYKLWRLTFPVSIIYNLFLISDLFKTVHIKDKKLL